MHPTSPKITFISWGHISLSVELLESKDYKLFPGGGRPWDWGETGTRHRPGIQVADVEELVSKGATDIVLSRGMDEKLGVPDDTVQWLKSKGVTVHVEETRKAVAIYNDLLEKGQTVAGLFHSTC